MFFNTDFANHLKIIYIFLNLNNQNTKKKSKKFFFLNVRINSYLRKVRKKSELFPFAHFYSYQLLQRI